MCTSLLRGKEGHQEGGHGVTDSLGSSGAHKLLVLAQLTGHQGITKVIFVTVAHRLGHGDGALLDNQKSLLDLGGGDRPIAIGLQPLCDVVRVHVKPLGLKLTLAGRKLVKQGLGQTGRTRRSPVSLDSLLAVGANGHVSMGRELGTLGGVVVLCCNDSTHASLLEQVIELKSVANVLLGHLDAEALNVLTVKSQVAHHIPRGSAGEFILPRPCIYNAIAEERTQYFYLLLCRFSDICSVLGQVREQGVCHTHDLAARVRAGTGLQYLGERLSALTSSLVPMFVDGGLSSHTTVAEGGDDEGITVTDDVDLAARVSGEHLNDARTGLTTVRVACPTGLGLSLALFGTERRSELGHDGLPLIRVEGLSVIPADTCIVTT